MTEIINIQEKENPLFNRKEIIVNVKTEASLSNIEAGELLSKKTSSPVENIKIRQILGNFGKPEFKIIAEIYKTKEDKEKYVKKTKQEKEAEKKADEEAIKAKAEAKAKEEEAKTAEEAPTEKKEETSEEKNQESKEENSEEQKVEEKPVENSEENKTQENK